MLITLHMFSLSVVCTLNTQLKLLPFKRYTVLRQTVNGNFNLTPTVYTRLSWVRDYIRTFSGEKLAKQTRRNSHSIANAQ